MSEIVETTDIRTILGKYKITIPIIQRDYVQGRKNQKSERVRKGLLKSIYNCLSDERDDTILDMNFIYGYCYEEEGQKTKFFPVDGQQRITAFYLLCWYLAVCSKDDDIAQKVNGFDFSYETRFSAGSFYQQFIKNCGELIDIVRNYTGSEMTKKIKALPSFHSEWQNDPTVTSSLIFLEDISGYENNVFGKNAALYFSRLGRIKFSPITNELSSKDEQSTEQHASDIYIRMNARGKPLEDFENIKAMFDRIEENIADGGSERLSFTYDNKYIHELFGYLKQPEKSLKDITNAINESSYIAFEQVFGLCGFEEDNMLDTVFWDSRKERKAIDDKKEKYQRFFYTVKALFDFFLKDKQKDKQKKYRAFFDNTFKKQGCCSKDILLIYYLYWFRKNHNDELPGENAADKLLEAADFILYRDPGKEVLDILARKVSGYDDIEKMFLEREWIELSDKESKYSIVGKGLEEFNVRLHELWLRTIVLNHESAQVTPEMIKAVTGQNPSAKLQFLFYISDMWYDTSGREVLRAEKLANLRKHFGTAVHFFPYGPKNDILHRKYYAAACYFDPDKKDFCSAEEINLCKRPHVWEKGYYEWDNDNNIPKEKLALIRRMYEHYDAIKDKIDSLTSLAADSPYRKCWLTYALMLDIKDILQNPVKVEKDQTVVKIIDGFKLIPKPVDAVILKNIDDRFQYGTKDFSASPCVMLPFSPESGFSEKGKFSISQTSHRNYNLWLYFKVDSNSINQKFVDTNSCVHSTDGKTDYIVRHCDSSDPFGSYKEYRFDITEYIEKTKKAQTQAANLCKALEDSQKLKWGIMFMSRKLVIYKSANAFSITENPDEISDNSIKVFTKNDKMIISDALKELEFPGKTQTRECIFEKIDYEGDPHSQQGELYELALKTVRPGAK